MQNGAQEARAAASRPAVRTLAAEHRSATQPTQTGGAGWNQMPGFPVVGPRAFSTRQRYLRRTIPLAKSVRDPILNLTPTALYSTPRLARAPENQVAS